MPLRVRVDGELLADDAARALWQRFSAHMDENKGDLAGFAAKEGFASVHPGMEDGGPVLLVSRTAPQRAYADVSRPSRSGGGSAEAQGQPPRPAGGTKKRRRNPH